MNIKGARANLVSKGNKGTKSAPVLNVLKCHFSKNFNWLDNKLRRTSKVLYCHFGAIYNFVAFQNINSFIFGHWKNW